MCTVLLMDTDSLSIGETARIIGVSVDTIRRWEAEGKLAGHRTPGNQRRFLRSDVDRLLTRNAA